MLAKRTDLAMEAQELWRESAEKTSRLSGVKAGKTRREGYTVTRVDILDKQGAAALGKPAGRYLTVDLSPYWQRREDYFSRAVRAVGAELKALLPREGAALVVGLGNRAMTPDAVGPLTLESILVTRHLRTAMPRQFGALRPVAAVGPGVLGSTGVEAQESVAGLVEKIRPDFVIAVDALAARRTARVCAAVQLSDSGIVPGSGVGNHRAALDRETLGLPVFSLGVPTVVDAATLASDLLEESGGAALDEKKSKRQGALMVTPRDVDAQVRELSKVLGYAVNWALQDLEIEDMAALLG